MEGKDIVHDRETGLVAAVVKDGRPLIRWTGLALIFSGCFAIFLSVTGQFLPHDVEFLGMSAHALCTLSDCRVVYFMLHDRVAFGGALIAVGLLYLWLVEFPLRGGQAWAWWTLVWSGIVGFGSFLAYLGYGYLDTWHGVGTAFLAPLFAWGIIQSKTIIRPKPSLRAAFRPAAPLEWSTKPGVGRLLMLGTGLGMMLAGATILIVGMTTVFVPQDLDYMNLTPSELHSVNPRLIPLIAHDRAGFGGGIFTCGLIVLLSVWCSPPIRSFKQVLALAGLTGFGCAIGVHFVIGYLDFTHLAPAYAGLAIYLLGLYLLRPAEPDAFTGVG